jgi:uncharacterized cupin superfamily protein
LRTKFINDKPYINNYIQKAFAPKIRCFRDFHGIDFLNKRGINMSDTKKFVGIKAVDVPTRTKPSTYPEPYFSQMAGREKRQLGDFFHLKNFGVNLTRLSPKSQSSLFHRHSKQDEFIYILEGKPTLVTDEGQALLEPGMCAGFPAGGTAHQLLNLTDTDVLYLEVGDRSEGDEGVYPRDDLKAIFGPDGRWIFAHKDGTLY